ncbi:hypothetical protein BKA67DRAFT_571044 [Truncatella angustata]|uniref:Uncharacterized protein n=1 Tax=Truncatella angustata TaxID=152316 RepID=A0A9P8UFY6_9PEZI|nr:uncharacterized protein BKA67DRAFT_571044 [Truncatella angustata]KAH6651476.1 hypothetical protein BKA67DRAFT_571044 [Truncatella angustata]
MTPIIRHTIRDLILISTNRLPVLEETFLTTLLRYSISKAVLTMQAFTQGCLSDICTKPEIPWATSCI